MQPLHRSETPAVRPRRLGLAVSRKVDKRAVGRNRIKRVLRDCFRHHRPWTARRRLRRGGARRRRQVQPAIRAAPGFCRPAAPRRRVAHGRAPAQCRRASLHPPPIRVGPPAGRACAAHEPDPCFPAFRLADGGDPVVDGVGQATEPRRRPRPWPRRHHAGGSVPACRRRRRRTGAARRPEPPAAPAGDPADRAGRQRHRPGHGHHRRAARDPGRRRVLRGRPAAATRRRKSTPAARRCACSTRTGELLRRPERLGQRQPGARRAT